MGEKIGIKSKLKSVTTVIRSPGCCASRYPWSCSITQQRGESIPHPRRRGNERRDTNNNPSDEKSLCSLSVCMCEFPFHTCVCAPSKMCVFICVKVFVCI